MAATTPVGTKIIAIAVLIPFGVIAWLAAPYLLPVWRWQNLDGPDAWTAISKQYDVPVTQLKTEISMIVRFHERGQKDPFPWQVVTSTPTWADMNPDKNLNEDKLLVRVALISDRDGTAPSELWVGANEDQKYFRLKAWRFPAGSFGLGKNKRPVVVYQGGSFEQIPIGEAQGFKGECPSWETDDPMEDRDDGYTR